MSQIYKKNILYNKMAVYTIILQDGMEKKIFLALLKQF